jgi:hypothetical protein
VWTAQHGDEGAVVSSVGGLLSTVATTSSI